jgi:hypothetical protein
MSNFFNNPNAHSVVVDRVPCAFAKAHNGESGTHYTVVIFDKKQNVLYVGSECEHKHGEAVQAFHEMGGETCFSVTAKFRAALGRVKSLRGQSISSYRNELGELHGASPLMRAAFNTTKEHMIEVHNSRVSKEAAERPMEVVALQRLVDKLTRSVMTLPSVTSVGKHSHRVSHFHKHVTLVPRVLEVRNVTHTYSFTHNGFVLPSGNYLHLTTPLDTTTFAVREPEQKKWLVDESAVRRWAENNHTSIVRNEQFSIPGSKCVFCGESYERMGKHTRGMKHKERVLDVVKLVCKAISPTGLRMINNPKHASAFFRAL